MKKKVSVGILGALIMLLCGSGGAQAGVVLPPKTAAGFTDMFQQMNTELWSGGDQTTSFKAPNGKTYWLFGDTMSGTEQADGAYSPGVKMLSNRILLQQGGAFVNARDNGGIGVPDPPTHTEENAERYWPQSMFYANGFLYVLCQRVINNGDATTLGFDSIGTEMAKFSTTFDGKLKFLGMVVTPSTGIKGGAGAWKTQWAGDSFVKDGYLYVYGYTGASGNPYVIHYSYVARMPVSQVENANAWQYYKKSTKTWVNSVMLLNGTDVKDQPDAILPTQISSARLISGMVHILHKPWNGWGGWVDLSSSANPAGPFISTNKIQSPEPAHQFNPTEKWKGTWEGKKYWTYSPQLHPEQPLTSGKVLVSVAWNGLDIWADTLSNADLYKPRFYEITVP